MKPVKLIQILLSLVVMVTLLTGNVQAALKAAGPTDLITTLPVYYLDTANLALMPCLDQNGFCILPPPFDALTVPTSTITTTGPITGANFPFEAFFYSAGALMNIEAGVKARLDYVLEYAFLGGVFPGGGTTFLRTDLAKMRLGAANANTTYKVTHAYGTFNFSTDANGDTINVGGGNGIAVRQEDGTGVPANYLPPLMQNATNTNMGPFLRAASVPGGTPLPLLTAVVGGATHSYIGDALTPVPVTGSPTGNNFFRIDKLNAQGVSVANWQVNAFTLAGRVFTDPIASPLNIDRATYARDANSGQVDIFATALPAAILTLSGTGITTGPLTPATPATGKFFLDIPLGTTTLPTSVILNNNLDSPAIPYPVTLVDEIIISKANYNPTNQVLTIKAASRDTLAPLPALTAAGFSAPNTFDAAGVFTKTLTSIPPQHVTVTSSKFGSATAPVSVGVLDVPPVALADSAATPAGATVIINVTANDSATAPAALNLGSLAVSAATGGTAVANSDGTISYTAPATPGAYNFTYTVKDTAVPALTSNVASVVVTVTIPPPNTPTLNSPSGIIASTTPTYTWNAVASATSYSIFLWDATASTSTVTTVSAAAALCPAGTGTCSTPQTPALSVGSSYAWYVSASNVSGTSPWSNFSSFSITNPVSVPVAPTQVSPSGGVSVGTAPVYTWNAVAGATSYSIFLWNAAASTSTITNVTASAALCPAGTGTCSTTQTPVLTGTSYAWYVNASNTAGTSPWSNFSSFTTTNPVPAPVTPIQISPSGTGATTAPTYTWNAVANATSYSIFLWDATTSTSTITNVTASAALCPNGTGTCSLIQAPALAGTSYAWYVNASNATGTSPWSNFSIFRP